MKKLLAPFVLSALVAFGLFACLSGDSKNSGGGGSTSGNLKVVSLDAVNNVLVTQIINYSCVGSTVVSDTTLDTISFAIVGGKLYTWNANGDFANNPDDCYADVATGTSTNGIIGTWTASSTPEPIPTQPAACPVPLPAYAGNGSGIANIPDGMTMTYVVTATNVTISLTGDACMAEMMAQELHTQMTGVTVVSSSCNSAVIRNDGSLNTVKPTATLTSSSGNGLMTLTFQSGTTTCTGVQSYSLPGVAPVCPEQVFTDAFNICVAGSGFFTAPTPMPFPKISAGL